MIRRLSCAAVWLLLLLAILVSPGSSAQLGSYDCPFCSIKLWSATLERDDSGKVTGGVPATFAYNNLWNTRGARGHQTLTAGSEALWSTEWDWKRGQGYTVTSYVSTVSGWHWGETYKLVTPPRALRDRGTYSATRPPVVPTNTVLSNTHQVNCRVRLRTQCGVLRQARHHLPVRRRLRSLVP